MKTVYVIGSGASFSDELYFQEKGVTRPLCPPPMIRGFFSAALLEQLGREALGVEKQFGDMVGYIRRFHLQRDAGPFGVGAWERLDLEDVFTSVEIDREFYPPSSTKYAELQIVRNQLIDYIRMVIGLCTSGVSGRHTETLVSLVNPDDTVITFNWDLLLDDAFGHSTRRHYTRFLRHTGVIDEHDPVNFMFGDVGGHGLFLKLHGSLNWFQCTNPGCSKAKGFIFASETNTALNTGIEGSANRCERCQASLDALIVPPVLRKPIFEHDIIQSAWRLAVDELESADWVVLIGFSAAKTDFYASWLLRTHVPSNAAVFVVNPDNSDDFKRRMSELFPFGWNGNFKKFQEISAIHKAICAQSDAAGA